MQPHEIQFGILKRLRGTPIIRHTKEYGLVFDPHPPYTILATDRISFNEMQQLVRFARYWDLVANSGRFTNTLPLILDAVMSDSAFANFMQLSNWLYATTDATNRIALERLAVLVAKWLVSIGMDEEQVTAVLRSDYAGQANTKLKTQASKKAEHSAEKKAEHAALPQRQARHMAA